MMQQVFIGLGANLGEPESTLKEAVLRIADIPGVRFVQVSSLYKTEPIDSSGPDYTNAVLEIKTELSPRLLLTQLLAIESDLGRVRPAGVHNAPRTIDLEPSCRRRAVLRRSFCSPSASAHDGAGLRVSSSCRDSAAV